MRPQLPTYHAQCQYARVAAALQEDFSLQSHCAEQFESYLLRLGTQLGGGAVAMLSIVNSSCCKWRQLERLGYYINHHQLASGKYVQSAASLRMCNRAEQHQQPEEQALQTLKKSSATITSSLTSASASASASSLPVSKTALAKTSLPSTGATRRQQLDSQQPPPKQHQQGDYLKQQSVLRQHQQDEPQLLQPQHQPQQPQQPQQQQKPVQSEQRTHIMGYNIDWVFASMRNPSGFWYIASSVAVFAVGLFSKIVLGFMNNTVVYHKERLLDVVAKRPPGVPLVTVSNHHSCFDDPGLWGVLPVRYVCNTFKIRWSMAAHDICFTNKYHSLFFMYGKCIPVVRGVGVYQDAVNLCIQKCSLGHWVHVFPEGKVNMTKEEMRLKWGVGRIIYESPRIPIIVPMWHEGMDEVLPNVEPYIIKWRKLVTLNIGEPIDLNDFIQDLKDRNVPEPEARKLITDKIQNVFHDLRLETEKLHRKRK